MCSGPGRRSSHSYRSFEQHGCQEEQGDYAKSPAFCSEKVHSPQKLPRTGLSVSYRLPFFVIACRQKLILLPAKVCRHRAPNSCFSLMAEVFATAHQHRTLVKFQDSVTRVAKIEARPFFNSASRGLSRLLCIIDADDGQTHDSCRR